MRRALRGVVWMAIGLGVYAYGEATDTPIVIRGTEVSWGLVVAGIGVVILLWDLVRGRKQIDR